MFVLDFIYKFAIKKKKEEEREGEREEGEEKQKQKQLPAIVVKRLFKGLWEQIQMQRFF